MKEHGKYTCQDSFNQTFIGRQPDMRNEQSEFRIRDSWHLSGKTNDVQEIDPKSLRKLTYGLFVLSSKDEKDNACIVNTAVQVASDPTKITVSVQKENLTGEIIMKTGKFNVSVLTEKTPFELIKHFGMQSGRDVDKFKDYSDAETSINGIKYIAKYTNAYFSAKVISTTDLGSHTLFVGEITEAKVLNDEPSCTYAYYHSDIKPKI